MASRKAFLKDNLDDHTSILSPLPNTGTVMMRMAVAGTGGLARAIAHRIDADTSHTVVFLSRFVRMPLPYGTQGILPHQRCNIEIKSHLVMSLTGQQEKPDLEALGFQVAVVDYANQESLKFALLGIDTVISTVMGVSQIELIKAAVAVRVRRFAPAEFEGSPQYRDPTNQLDNGRSVALGWLAHFHEKLEYTAFVCGVLYERFLPGGLASCQMGSSTGLDNAGDYIIDWATMTAQIPAYNTANEEVFIRMTAVEDVARFVTRALDLPAWPPEMRMSGQRMSVSQLVIQASNIRGLPFVAHEMHTPDTLLAQYHHARLVNDTLRQTRIVALINTANGYYDFDDGFSLNGIFPDVLPLGFSAWLFARLSG